MIFLTILLMNTSFQNTNSLLMACPKAKDYGRGVGKILLGRVGKATVPKEIISKLQLREESEIIKAVIQKAHQELLTQCSLIFINDLLIIVLDYLTRRG